MTLAVCKVTNAAAYKAGARKHVRLKHDMSGRLAIAGHMLSKMRCTFQSFAEACGATQNLVFLGWDFELDTGVCRLLQTPHYIVSTEVAFAEGIGRTSSRTRVARCACGRSLGIARIPSYPISTPAHCRVCARLLNIPNP